MGRYSLEDSVLADEIEQVERSSADARATREKIKKAIEPNAILAPFTCGVLGNLLSPADRAKSSFG
jgi:hypothetical protein